jgi:hypothetical protein
VRVVLDTNVVVSALLWGGTPRVMLETAREREIKLFTSTPLLAELSDVLNRRKFEKKIAASLFTVDQIVDRYAALAGLVRPEPTPRITLDPGDDVVIGTALAARANLIVSGDSHLLELKIFQGVPIVTAADAIAHFS